MIRAAKGSTEAVKRELIARAQQGDIVARNALVEQHLPMVRSIARQYRAGHPTDDLLQAGALGLIDAIERFDLSRKTAFATYGWLWARKRILEERHGTRGGVVRCSSRTAVVPDVMAIDDADSQLVDPDGLPPDELLQRAADRDRCRRALRRLDVGHRRVLRWRLNGKRFRAISAELGVSRARAQQIYNEAVDEFHQAWLNIAAGRRRKTRSARRKAVAL